MDINEGLLSLGLVGVFAYAYGACLAIIKISCSAKRVLLEIIIFLSNSTPKGKLTPGN